MSTSAMADTANGPSTMPPSIIRASAQPMPKGSTTAAGSSRRAKTPTSSSRHISAARPTSGRPAWAAHASASTTSELAREMPVRRAMS